MALPLADDRLAVDPTDHTVQVTVRYADGSGYTYYPPLSVLVAALPSLLRKARVETINIDKTDIGVWP